MAVFTSLWPTAKPMSLRRRGGSKANEQTLQTGMNEWKSVETRRNVKKTSETRMNESCEREKMFALQTPSVAMQEVKSERSKANVCNNLCETQETTPKSNSYRQFGHIECPHPRAVVLVTCAIIIKASPIFG